MSLYPIKYQNIYEAFKKQRRCFWQPDEIDLSKDIFDWEKLNSEEQYFLGNIISFFAGADGIIMDNINLNFIDEFKAPEVKAFLSFQSGMEAIHNETYGILLDTYIKDNELKIYYQNGIKNIESVKKKSKWANKWLQRSSASLSERVIAMVCVEGILFAGSFCAIFWIKKRGLLPGLCFSNELISRDENMHTEFSIMLYKIFCSPITDEKIKEIFKEAVENEKLFITESLPCKLVGMNSNLMCQYIEYICDFWLEKLNCDPIYNSKNPFDFMINISLSGKTNFFEKRVGEYSSSHTDEKVSFDTTANF